jgi:hypothetical protein
MGEEYSLFDDFDASNADIGAPRESRNKIKNRKIEAQKDEVIEFHDPLVCERVKIQCEKCKIVYAVILRENNNYGFCG